MTELEYNGIRLGGNSHYDFRIISMEGFGLPSKRYNVAELVGFDGQFTKDRTYSPRTMTVSFDVGNKTLQYDSNRIFRAFSEEGHWLNCTFGNVKRRIKIDQTDVGDFENMSVFRKFVVQLTADEPFFTDFTTVRKNCFELTKNIKYADGKWNLDTPNYWGIVENNVLINNTGDVNAEPVIYIQNTQSPQEILPESEEIGIEILNKTTGQRLKIDTTTQAGEIITVNLNARNDKKKRYIESSISGDITGKRDKDTSLSKFWLAPGENNIVVNNYNSNERITAFIEFEPKYLTGGM